MKKQLVFLIAVLAFALNVGCAKRIKMTVDLKPVDEIEKTDEFGEPTATLLRIYQLRSADRFNQAVFSDLFYKPRDLLKEDLLSIEKEKIVFDKKQYFKYKAEKETRFVGVVAKLHKKEDNHGWRRIFSLGDKQLRTIDIELKKIALPDKNTYIPISLTLDQKPQLDSFGEPVPALVRIYQLKDPARFKEAQVFDLFLNDKTLLAEDLISTHKLKVFPQKKVIGKIKLEKGTKLIGIISRLYKTDDKRYWKRAFAPDNPTLQNMAIALIKDKPDAVEMTFTPDKEMNLGLPTTFRVYRLKDSGKFLNANFKELWKRDQEILEGELIGKNKVNVYPGKKEAITIKRGDDVNYIGLVANFRRRGVEKTWKKVINLSEKKFKKAEKLSIVVKKSSFAIHLPE